MRYSPFQFLLRSVFVLVTLSGVLQVFPSVSTTYAYSLHTANTDSHFTGCNAEEVAPINEEFEARIVELVNLERAAVGLPPMKNSLELTKAARYHATDMAEDFYMHHDSHDRVDDELVRQCKWWERIWNFHTGPRAENMHWGAATPEDAMDAWMYSDDHRENILGDAWEIGVGYDRLYWVQDFGQQPLVYPLIANREAYAADSPTVELYIYGDWEEMRLRNDDSEWSAWQQFANTIEWTLEDAPGLRTVEAELRKAGHPTAHSRDTIYLSENRSPANTPESPTATPASTLISTSTATPQPTHTPTYTPTSTPTPTPTPTATYTPTPSPVPTATPTATATPEPAEPAGSNDSAGDNLSNHLSLKLYLPLLATSE